MALTQNLSLYKPTVGEHGWGDAVNANFDKLDAGVYVVTAHGAVGDGVTGDTAAIQNAIDTCAGAGGGIVYFPPGTYRISPAGTLGGRQYGLLLKGGVTLMGASTTSSTIRAADSSNMDVVTSDRLTTSAGIGIKS